MTIKTRFTVTEERTEEKEIELPYYCSCNTKFGPIQHLMVISEQEVLTVQNTSHLASITLYPLHVWTEQIGKAEPISREEFMARLDEVFSRLNRCSQVAPPVPAVEEEDWEDFKSRQL